MAITDLPPTATDKTGPRALPTLVRFMSPTRRRQAVMLALLMPIAAVAEMASVALVVPLLALLARDRAFNKLQRYII